MMEASRQEGLSSDYALKDLGKEKKKKLPADASGPAAIPRKNGELVFETPWESRAFGIAVALSERGVYDWEEFRQGLIAEIGESERKNFPSGGTWNYYELWTTSLEKLLLEKGIVKKEEMAQRVAQVEATWKHDEKHHHYGSTF